MMMKYKKIDFKLTYDLMRPEEYDEITLNLNRKF